MGYYLMVENQSYIHIKNMLNLKKIGDQTEYLPSQHPSEDNNTCSGIISTTALAMDNMIACSLPTMTSFRFKSFLIYIPLDPLLLRFF